MASVESDEGAGRRGARTREGGLYLLTPLHRIYKVQPVPACDVATLTELAVIWLSSGGDEHATEHARGAIRMEEAEPSALVGFEVEIHGLAARPELNGRVGMVMGTSGNERVAVNLIGTKPIALKPRNLKRLARVPDVPKPAHLGTDDARLAQGCDRTRNQSDPCGDGDQSPLVDGFGDSAGGQVREVWASGADFNPFLGRDLYPPFYAACAWGDEFVVRAFLSEESPELERRESKLRYSPLHACVAGSRVAYGSSDWPRRETLQMMGFPLPQLVPDHCAVARLLIERRARTEARDIMGHTPLALACGTHATTGSLKVARILVAGGASVHTVDRFGNTVMYVLMGVPMGGVRYDVVEALMQMGFDVDRPFKLQCIGTVTMRTVAAHILADREAGEQLLKLFAKYSKPPAAEPSLDGMLPQMRKAVEARTAPERTSQPPLKSPSVKGPSAAAPAVEVVPANEGSLPASESTRLEYGAPVRLGRLVSRVDLNGARGYVLGFADGRYEVELAADGSQMRLKPENVDGDAHGGDADAAVDPRKLRSWPGFGVEYVQDIRNRDHRPVAWCFQQAMPLGAKMTLAGHSRLGLAASEKALAPFAQWVYSLFHVRRSYRAVAVHPPGHGRPPCALAVHPPGHGHPPVCLDENPLVPS